MRRASSSTKVLMAIQFTLVIAAYLCIFPYEAELETLGGWLAIASIAVGIVAYADNTGRL